MSNQFKVSKLWAQRVQEHRIALPAVLRRAGLPAVFFQQEKIYVTTSELFALWRAVGEMSGDPVIGLKLGAEARLERYDPAAIAAVCSRSFRDAVQRIAFYAGPGTQRLFAEGNQPPDPAKRVASKGYAARDTSGKLSPWTFARRPFSTVAANEF